MLRKALLAVGLLVGFLASPSFAQQASWDGTYSYTHDGGRTAGGSPILQTWRLTVEAGNCLLKGEGFQLLETLRCATDATAQTLDVRFVSFGDGGATNAAGIGTYKKGDKLFTLSRASNRLLTRWHRFVVEEGLPSTPGVWFRKVNVAAGASSEGKAITRAPVRAPAELFGTPVALDGDTLAFDGIEADLWTIDAPELGQPCTRGGKLWKCGESSRKHLSSLISGRSVACRRQGSPEGDGRFVGLCFVSDEPCAGGVACESDLTSLNLAMVSQGWALDLEGQYMDPQDDAKEKRIGLWSGSVENPWEWREGRK